MKIRSGNTCQNKADANFLNLQFQMGEGKQRRNGRTAKKIPNKTERNKQKKRRVYGVYEKKHALVCKGI